MHYSCPYLSRAKRLFLGRAPSPVVGTLQRPASEQSVTCPSPAAFVAGSDSRFAIIRRSRAAARYPTSSSMISTMVARMGCENGKLGTGLIGAEWPVLENAGGLFWFKTRIVGTDAAAVAVLFCHQRLGEIFEWPLNRPRSAKPLIAHFFAIEDCGSLPLSKRCVVPDVPTRSLSDNRRYHQIPTEQGKRSGVAKPHAALSL